MASIVGVASFVTVSVLMGTWTVFRQQKERDLAKESLLQRGRETRDLEAAQRRAEREAREALRSSAGLAKCIPKDGYASLQQARESAIPVVQAVPIRQAVATTRFQIPFRIIPTTNMRRIIYRSLQGRVEGHRLPPGQ